MQLSPLPDIGSNRRLTWTALIVAFGVCAVLSWHDADIVKALGDTDDAMRLVLVRDLLHGRGWWDQWVGRLQPPEGTYMHWSRLLDGALAGLIWLGERLVSPAMAELVVRFVWPLLWIFPAVGCGLLIARSLGGRPAVFVCAVLLATNIQLYLQFRPGRVDHHNIQITMALVAAACSLAGAHRTRWAVLGGIAAALGLCIGIEALAFQAVIGASYALRLARNPDKARPARAYGLSLALASTVFYAIQTPPWRWSMSFCDAIGWNLVAALGVAGFGMAAVATWAERSPAVRAGLIGLVGAASAAVFLIADPQCLRGPFAAVDPRLLPFWFDKIQELQSWSQLLRHDRASAVRVMVMTAMAAAAAGYLLWRERARPMAATLLAVGLVAVAGWAAADAYRMQDYIYWFGAPTLAAAISLLAERYLRGLMLPTLMAAVLLSPFVVAAAIVGLVDMAPKRAVAARGPTDERCYDVAPYRPLAALPPGVVLAEIDLGPFILAETKDSVLAAPYHRMAWGILAAHDALGAAPAEAEAKVRALNVAYVVECPANPLRVGPTSFEGLLRKGQVPSWLQPVSLPGQVLRIYRVLTAKPGARPSATVG
jgi:hypothetical protein